MNAVDVAKHKQVWNSARTIQVYAAVDNLQKPEKAIIDALRDRLPHMRMLDLGIGGGRTTVHFAPLVKEYVGSDYAENMVEACRKRFPNAGPHVSFELIDATDMREVPTHSFDFILFSFNSIDCVTIEQRAQVFREVQRVGKAGGYFAFSSHNTLYIDKMYRFKWYKRWRDFLYQFYRIAMLLYYNGLPGKHQRRDFTEIRDGVEHFSIGVYYSKPAYEVQELVKMGFRNIRMFSLKTGAEIPLHQANTLNDAWVYYLCEI